MPCIRAEIAAQIAARFPWSLKPKYAETIAAAIAATLEQGASLAEHPNLSCLLTRRRARQAGAEGPRW